MINKEYFEQLLNEYGDVSKREVEGSETLNLLSPFEQEEMQSLEDDTENAKKRLYDYLFDGILWEDLWEFAKSKKG